MDGRTRRGADLRLTREQIQGEHIEADYDPRWHVGACAASAAATIGVAAWQLSALQPWHWIAFAGTIVLDNAGEYFLHRGPFHAPLPGMRWLYHRHTTMHHNMFDDASMAYDSARDLKWIMLPSWGFAATVAVMSPLLGGLWLIEPNLMWMYLLAQGSYYAVYELLHTASHLPQDHWLAQSRLVKAVSRHHRIHHDRRLMRKFNFNFALPLFDWICGTLYRERHACDDEQDSAHDTERDGAWRDTPAGS